MSGMKESHELPECEQVVRLWFTRRVCETESAGSQGPLSADLEKFHQRAVS